MSLVLLLLPTSTQWEWCDYLLALFAQPVSSLAPKHSACTHSPPETHHFRAGCCNFLLHKWYNVSTKGWVEQCLLKRFLFFYIVLFFFKPGSGGYLTSSYHSFLFFPGSNAYAYKFDFCCWKHNIAMHCG